MHTRLLLAGAVLAATTALAPAIVSGDGTVDVELTEFSITPSVTEVEAGAVTFNVANVGGAPHELVIIATDLAADALPLTDGNLVDEAQVTIVAETEVFRADTSPQTLSADLAPGSYVLICNVFNPSFAPGHYVRGMNVAFTVTEGAAAAPAATPATTDQAPTAPAAGNAGLLDGGSTTTSALVVALLALLTVGAVAGARRLGGRTR